MLFDRKCVIMIKNHKENHTLQIRHGETPNILLLGNGINRTYGFDGDYRAYYQNICERLKAEINEKVKAFL